MTGEMEDLQNKVIDRELNEEFLELSNTENYKIPWKYVLRQVLISSGVWANFFTLGLCLGAPTVIVPQLRRDANSTDVVSDEMLSWLSSSSSYSGMLQVIILTILPSCLGRKHCFLLVSTVAMIGFVLLYVSTTITQILISTIIHGILSASHITISIMIITEYSSPQYRGIFLTTKSASFLWGVWISNITGTFFHWKYIALVGIVTTAYILLTVLMWPESPFWLASKRRFGECATAHYWLKGASSTSRKELKDLIAFYKDDPSFSSDKGSSTKTDNEIIWKKVIAMESYSYKEVVEAEADHKNIEGNKINRTSLLRQIMVCNAIWSSYFSIGLCLGSPTVIIPQIRQEFNSSDATSQEIASWLSSGIAYSATIQVIIFSILPKFMGRKACFLLASFIAMIGFVVLYFSRTATHLIIFESIEGVLFACQITICIMIITEYTSPRYRGIFLTMKSASLMCGVWVSKAIGTYFHWSNIAVVGCVVTVYIIITTLNWPESPYWLATRGRLNECRVAHHWLKGNSEESQKELENLIERQTALSRDEENDRENLIMFCAVIQKNTFYKPILLSMLILTLYNLLGKIASTIYAKDIIQQFTGSESRAYTIMLVLDGVTIVGVYMGCAISRYARRRSFLIITSGFGVMFLYLLSLFLYLVSSGLVENNVHISLFLLFCYSVTVSSGPMIMSTSLVSELMPLSNRNMFAFLIGTFSNFIFATFIKITPFLFSSYGFSATFFIYASTAFCSLILIFIYLPETKDKTLIEIEKLHTKNEPKSKKRSEL
ncbi:Facilitated trehalose transporter Tret1 [Papilio machaon]|uniref:Facilitated trehalose transporter Tret1 n=1 Tax=Papilio machaon TaxID=76193 RepID=A0A194R9C4_PAPMA|nr:Facilitated trehalose transporter Tret1 [Papilio machaon]